MPGFCHEYGTAASTIEIRLLIEKGPTYILADVL
jgi:hypothetical protein